MGRRPSIPAAVCPNRLHRRDHLDYTSLKFSVNTGWLSPSSLGSGECNSDNNPAVYTCTIASNTHIYVDTFGR